ncbi:hypothetical protein ACFQ3Z_00185 [Streptomyces nogalater]
MEVFTDRVPGKRLLILGEPGAGKTMMLLRLLLGLIRTRQPGSPVPVIFPWPPGTPTIRSSAHGWPIASPPTTRAWPDRPLPRPPTATADPHREPARCWTNTWSFPCSTESTNCPRTPVPWPWTPSTAPCLPAPHSS